MPSAKPRVYNLFWFSKKPGQIHHPAPVTRRVPSTVSKKVGFDSIILYPALGTPEILSGDDDLEILILSQCKSLHRFKEQLPLQLKITYNFDPDKPANERPLLVDGSGELVGLAPHVKIVPVTQDEEGSLNPVETESKHFRGIIDHRAWKIFTDAGYATLYSITVSNKCLAAGLGGSSSTQNGGMEPQDLLMQKAVFDQRHPELKKPFAPYYFCFAKGEGDIDTTDFNDREPVQSFHPVYHYEDGLSYADITHLSDLHLSARQQILAKTNARVIDFATQGCEADKDISPRLGSMINICSRDVVEILGKIASSGADVLALGGDLVDFLRNRFLEPGLADSVSTGKASKIWEAVDLDDYLSTHIVGVDMVSFYGILVDFCRSSGMPTYMVTGNHDCYLEPYGLSPRIAARAPGDSWWQGDGTGLFKANPGIPADHNLTIYEAVLAFGETYDQHKAPITSNSVSPFNVKMYDWFYMVFTPFSDFAVELPNQVFCGLAWGDDETMIDLVPSGHGLTHLPRPNQAISPPQFDVFETAAAKNKKLILMTHFTFVSYLESIRMDGADREMGEVYISDLKSFSTYNLGTFELNRPEMFADHLVKKRDVQIVLTGHSHRRGLYLLDSLEGEGWSLELKKVRTRYFDFPAFASAKAEFPGIIEPAVIVSDSGAPIPRYNKLDEFSGLGSDQPSGTKITFDQGTGEITRIESLRAERCHPRVAVALDYLDLSGDDVIVSIESDEIEIEDEKDGTLSWIPFQVVLSDDTMRIGMTIQSVYLYSKVSKNGPWRKIPMVKFGLDQFAISGEDQVDKFVRFFAPNQDRGNFMAMKFIPLGWLPRYNFGDPWCFEFQVDYSTSGRGLFHWSPTKKMYKLKRQKARAEIPSFQWRERIVPNKYE